MKSFFLGLIPIQLLLNYDADEGLPFRPSSRKNLLGFLSFKSLGRSMQNQYESGGALSPPKN